MKLPQILILTTATLLFSFNPALLRENSIFPSRLNAQTTETETKEAEADRLLNQGIEQYQISEYQLAIESWQKALKLYREINDRSGVAKSLGNLGVVYDSIGEYSKAIDYYEQSLAILQEIGDRSGVAYSLGNLGIVYDSIGEYSKAIDYYEQSLAILQEIGDRSGVAVSLGNLGVVYKSLGEYSKAIDYYQQSLAILQEIGDRSGEAKSLGNLGNVYENSGEYGKAIDYYQQSLPIFQEIGERSGEAHSLNNLGHVYENLGEYGKAIEYYQQSLSISQKIGDRRSEAKSLDNLGCVYWNLGEYGKAIDYFKQSLPIFQEIGDLKGLLTFSSNFCLFHHDLGQYGKAIECYQLSLSISQKIGDRSSVANSLMGLGSVYYSIGEYSKTIDYYQQSLAIKQEIGDRSGVAKSFNNLAVSFKAQNQLQLAIVFYKQSVNTYEAIREDIKALSTKEQQSFINTIEKTYRNLADLLIQQDRILEAQRVLDLLKIQELEDFIEDVRGNENTQKGIDLLPPESQIWLGYQTIIDKAVILSTKISKIELYDEIGLRKDAPEELAEIAQLESESEQIIAQLTPFLQSPQTKQNLAQLTPETIKTIELEKITALQNDLKSLEQNAVLLYSVIFEDRLDLILTTPNSPPIRKSVNITKTELNQAILDFREALTNPSSDAITPAQKLYNLVIKPIESELEKANADTIIYAPDTQFRYIPLAALHDGEKWLTEKYQVNHITALALTDFQQQSQGNINILAGAFVHGTHEFDIGDKKYRFNGLLGAEREVKNIGNKFPNITFIDSQFNINNTVPEMSNHSIIHLATHAAFVVGRPEESFILFGDGSRTNLKEVERTWKLDNVDLIVLSACETGINGQFGKGQEILGFGYLMQLAGARASIASLWTVSDSGTQILMETFYEILKQEPNMSKNEALQLAQQALINSKNNEININWRSNRGTTVQVTLKPDAKIKLKSSLSHPYYWSPFILIGNGL